MAVDRGAEQPIDLCPQDERLSCSRPIRPQVTLRSNDHTERRNDQPNTRWASALPPA